MKWFIKNDSTEQLFVVETQNNESSEHVFAKFLSMTNNNKEHCSIHNDNNFFIGKDDQLYRCAFSYKNMNIDEKKITNYYKLINFDLYKNENMVDMIKEKYSWMGNMEII